jgi:hypothetical protein
MSLINCPECGNECAATAVACPQCGHPFVKQVAQPRVIVKEVSREDSFPKWIFIPLALLGVVILFVLFIMLRKDETADQRNINVNLATARQPERLQTTTTVPTTSQPSTVTIPSTSQPSTLTVPEPINPPSTITSVPSTSTASSVTAPPPDKGTVVMEAKIISRTGGAQPVTKEKFYLLDKDLNSILDEANLQDDEGQGLVNAFGISVVNPNKYRDTNQKALAAIKRHIVYSTTTDGNGKAQLKDVKPNNYYLFGITKTRSGFAVWSSPVSINPGQNSLILDPVTPTEVIDNNQ